MTSVTAPPDVRYPWPADVLANPYPFYAWLRAHRPVARIDDGDTYAVARYDDVDRGLKDWQSLSSRDGPGYARIPIGGAVSLDPPEHARVRRLVQDFFAPPRMRRLATVVERHVADLLDRAAERQELDFISGVADVLPILTICELLDLPVAEAETFRRWADDAFALNAARSAESAQASGAAASLSAAVEYFTAVMAERTRRPGDDVLSRLLSTTVAGDRLTSFEAVTMARGLLTAGNGTTRAMLAHTARLLALNPHQWRRLRAEPARAAGAVEEVLRMEAPIQGFFRTARVDVAFGSTTIPAGARVMLLYGSANRDGSRFERPDQFDITRTPNHHRAFGAGPHFCVGAGLARLQGLALLRGMATRFAAMELTGPPVPNNTPVSRGIARLPVRLTPASARSG